MIVAEIQEILGALEQEKKTNGGWKELIWPGMAKPSYFLCDFSNSDNSPQLEEVQHLCPGEYILPNLRRKHDPVSSRRFSTWTLSPTLTPAGISLPL